MPTINKNLDIKVIRHRVEATAISWSTSGRQDKCEFRGGVARLFRGCSLFEAQHITSRICGICSCGHSLASIQAAEDALGV